MAGPKRNALNRGSAVYLGGLRVRFLWPCGCKRAESPTDVGNAESVRHLVSYWRKSGATLRQCRKHPDWHSRESQAMRLNEANPQK